MKNDGGQNLKKRVGRKYQFDPQDVSQKFQIVEEHVRKQILQDRAKLRAQHEFDRNQRRLLFNRLAEVRNAFIPPETRDEADTRALALNAQLVLKESQRESLLSLYQNIQEAIDSIQKPESSIFSTEALTTVEEELAEKEALEAIRKIRGAAFISELIGKSKLDLENREKELEQVIAERHQRTHEEKQEEERTLMGSDRKLLLSGAYRCSYKN